LDVAGIHSHTHPLGLGSLDQQQETHTDFSSRNILINEVEMSSTQPENSLGAFETGERMILSEPERREDLNLIQPPRLVGEANFADNTPSTQVLHNNIQSAMSIPSSAYSPSGSGYQNMFFDSNSINSESRASAASVSGRRGPMNRLGKLGMKAVRKVGACWRCRFLRKAVSEVNI
jgi:hypothetical protein